VPNRPAPKLGQDTEALLEELGYDAAAIEDLRTQGVI
jgi:crotonobetainyl-CoA:carnitine CoA-transferase CaiB-like acyl-CoA transferase